MGKRTYAGFTLIELLVAISVMGILAAIVLANLSGSSKQGRDADRQSDLQNLKNAVEAYKQKNGTYPAMGCSDSNGNGFSDEGDSGCVAYIAGLAPNFIERLPNDPSRGTNAGYAYLTNSEKSVYKIMVYNTVESETVTNTHAFKRCDTSGVLCGTSGDCAPSNSVYKKSYAVWGGFADGTNDTDVKNNTKSIICK